MFICLQKKGILPVNQLKLSAVCSTAVLKTFYKKNSFLSLPLQDKRKGTVNSLSSLSKLLGVSLQQQKFLGNFSKTCNLLSKT